MEIKRIHICDQPHKYWYEHIFNYYYEGSPHNSKHMFDIYSLTHIFWPMLLMLLMRDVLGYGRSVIIIFLISTFFEVYENQPEQIKKYHRIEVDSSGESSYRGDSTINIIGDILFNIFGIYLGYSIKSNKLAQLVLLMVFITITKVVGFNYWTEFITFALKTLK